MLGPLLFFCAAAARGAAQGNGEHYGPLGQRYAREFDRKWIRGGGLPPTSRCSAAPTSSRWRICATASSWSMACTMVPFSMRNIMTLAIARWLPVAPLLLTTFSVEELVDRLLRVLF